MTPHPPFSFGSPTSEAAAEQIASSAETLRAEVFAYIKAKGAEGATDDEIQQALGMAGNTQRPRRRELELASRIQKSGQQRKTLSGRLAAVWVIVG